MTVNRARWFSTAMTSVILPIALLTAVMIGLGLLITHVLVYVWPFTLEDQAIRTLVAVRTPALDRASNLISLAAYIEAIAAVTVVAGCLMRIAYHRWREFLFLAATGVAQVVIYEVTVRVVVRARPAVLELDVFPLMRSFFSGHTAAAVALYGGIALILAMHSRRRALAAAWWVMLLIIPIAVAISRMYRGEHYPSDVAASFIAGLGCVWIMQRAILAPTEQNGSSQP